MGRVNRARALVGGIGDRPGTTLSCMECSPAAIEGWNYDVAAGCMLSPGDRIRANARCCRYEVPYVDGSASGDR